MADQEPKPKKVVPLWAVVLTVCLTLLGGGAIGYGVKALTTPEPQLALPKGFDRVLGTYASIQRDYYQPVDSDKLADGATKGMLEALDDPYSQLLVNDDKTALDNTIDASFGGIGATIEQKGERLLVRELLPNTPAKQSGLQVGDQLIAVNGKNVEGQSVSKAVDQVRGKIGTKVTLTIKRGDNQLRFTMKRAKITEETVTAAISKQNKAVGIVTIATFSTPTAKQFKAAVTKLQKQGAKALVLDLRGNPGGQLDTALEIGSMLSRDGATLVQVQPRTGAKTVYKAGEQYDKGFKVTLPVSVLIDGQSASASEILAGLLRDNHKAKLVGTKSFGKGTVQNVAPMDDTREVKLTVAKWLTPDGTWVHHKGLTPDLKVAYPAYMSVQGLDGNSLTNGASGPAVRSLQTLLSAVGHTTSVTGSYDTTTGAAVEAFQQASRLPVTGTADKATQQALMVAAVAHFNANDPMVKAAVAALAP